MFQYRIGQLYMIARHSLEQSGDGEGVEVVENTECEDSVHGKGQFTEKRIHLSRYLKLTTLLQKYMAYITILTVVYHTGYNLLFQKSFMLLKKHGIIIRTP